MTPTKINETIMSLLPGDEIRINNWRCSMVIAGRSRHYLVAYNPKIDSAVPAHEYTIIPIPESVDDPVPECGPDYWILGFHANSSDKEFYDFTNPAWVAEYLASLEAGKTEISQRRSAPIARIIKSKEWLNG